MSVHYRFKSALEYDTITFDGLHISVKDLKNSIIHQKRIGKSTDFDLRITNAQTQEVYEDENALIPKNTSLLIARIPVTSPKQKQWEGYGGNDTPPSKLDEGGPIGKAMDLASLDAPEDDKIKAMMSQSTQDYDPSNYIKIRGANQVGPVPATYRCYKCHQNGHWIKDCPLGQGMEQSEIKKSTGIPQSFLVPVEGPQVPGAMMMANGQYAVPALDLQAYNQKHGPTPVQEPKPEIPEDLLCSICSDLLTDAVMIPCCGNSFCDECIRGVLLESEDHECPDCHEKDISPTTLIPNRFLRKSVATFKNTTGYEKKPVFKPKPDIPKEEPVKKEQTPPPVADSTEKESLKEEEKTVISEADSTEQGARSEPDFSKDVELETPKTDDVEGPPGVSPKNSPVHKIPSKVTRGERDRSRDKDKEHRSSKPNKPRRSRTPSPRKSRSRRSPSYEPRRTPERHGTPIRDEPPGIGGSYPPTTDSFAGPPGGVLPHGMPPGGPPMQGPPPGVPPGAFPPGQPPPFHPAGVPPNFRLPPPGTQPPPFMAPGPYPVPGVRPVFDPMGGPPGNFGPNFGGRPRDFPGRRGGRDRTPTGVIDDPLAAFNRILREKDEKRARQQRMARRSWSRSRSRSRSFSRSPPPLRRRSRSPRRRVSRSRSRSFSISRSRSRSYSHSPRGSPLPPSRRSPPLLQARRGPPGRFRSPHRSSPPRRRIDRDRVDFDRDYDRGGFRDKPRGRRADSRDRFYDDKEREYDRGARARVPPPVPAPTQQPQWGPQRDAFYPPPQGQTGPSYPNRFPQQIHHIQPERKYEEIAPPGVEQPPIPGLESEPPPVNEFEKRSKEKEEKKSPQRKERDRFSPRENTRDRRDRDRKREDKRSRSKSRTPEKWRNPSPRSSGTPERPRKRRSSAEPKDDKKRDKDRHRDHSEDDKRKSKDKKKHREKKEEKKKKKEKKDKHHKAKDKKKDEFKQVIPKGASDEDSDAVRKKIEERKKQREEEENKKLQEERKKEERRLRFLEDEKRKKEEEAKREEVKRKTIEEARRALEEEERQRLEREQEVKKIDLYDEIIPEQDLAREIRDDFSHHKVQPDVNVTPPIVDGMPKKEEDSRESVEEREVEEGEVTDDQDVVVVIKEGEEEDNGILELHSDMDIKLDEADILAPVPEKSKWEVDEDGQILQTSPSEFKELIDPKTKVSSEVLKRAENVIFARAINSIRPIEIKKITGERAKLYADEKPIEEPKKVEIPAEKPRLSVKERLGKKVDEPDPKIIIIDGPRSSSPFSRRDRRIEVEAHRRQDRRHSRSTHESNRDRDRHRSRTDRSSEKTKRNRRDERDRHEERTKEKRKRTRSRSESEEHKKKKKEKKVKKEKEKPKKHDESKKDESIEEKPKSTVEKRKATLDEASFEPDYDLELHEDEPSEPEKEPKKDKEARKSEASEEESSSSESSSSSSEEERKRKKRKARKKKKKRETSSSESESSSESSDSEKERKRKKHKKAKKKKKKAKHK